MLFNTPYYIFLFLPLVLFVYFALNRFHLVEAAKWFLVFASIVFYSWWDLNNLPILLFSILCNWAIVNGICAFYNITEMSERQTAGILGLLRAARDIVGSTNELSRYRKQFVIPTTDGVYISRFAIDKGMRGSGLASDLLHNAESNFQRLGAKRVSLHVRRDNKQALAFYVHAGYEPRVNQNLGYILLGKDLLDRTDRI